ncbi:MAG: TRAP transporter small permease subunit [Arenicella sp.]
MASNATVHEDDSLLSRLDRLYLKFEKFLTTLGGIAILLVVFLAVTNILGRWLFSLPVDGYIDWVVSAMPFIAFMGLSYTQREGGHIRMDIVVGSLRGRVLWFMEFLTVLIMLGMTVLLAQGSYNHFLRAFKNGDTTFDIDLLVWPTKLIIVFAFIVLLLRLLLQLWGYARALITGGDAPIAVPLVEDAATAAAREAASVESDKIEEGS